MLQPNGEPAPGATVELVPLAGPAEQIIRAGDDGTFAFSGLDKAEYFVRAMLFAKEPLSDWPLVSTGLRARKGDVGMTLRLGERAVLARVLDPDGNPVPWARASFFYVSPKRGRLVHGQVHRGRLVINTHDDGATTGWLKIDRAEDVGRGMLPLGDVRIEVDLGKEVVVRLPHEQTIEGRVLGPDGQGLQGAVVRAEQADDKSDESRLALEAPWTWDSEGFVRTDGDGAFRIRFLSKGKHWVAVLPPPAYAPPETVWRDAGATGVEFRVRAGVSTSVTVLDPEGRTIVGAQVVAVRKAGQEFLLETLFSKPLGWSVGGTTETYRGVRLEGFDPAVDYVLGVRGPAGTTWATIVKNPWRPEETTVRLAPGLPLSGSVLDAAGKPVREITVFCVDASGVSRSARTNERGSFRFVGLAAGNVRVSAYPDDIFDARALRAEATVEAGAEGVELLLK